MSATLRKSLTDLTRRKARTFFTLLTLALAVASVGILAVSPLMDQSMKREVAATRLSDLTVSMNGYRFDTNSWNGAIPSRSIVAMCSGSF